MIYVSEIRKINKNKHKVIISDCLRDFNYSFYLAMIIRVILLLLILFLLPLYTAAS